jgi:hypothetical protein
METNLSRNFLRIHTMAYEKQHDYEASICRMQAFSESRKRGTEPKFQPKMRGVMAPRAKSNHVLPLILAGVAAVGATLEA